MRTITDSPWSVVYRLPRAERMALVYEAKRHQLDRMDPAPCKWCVEDINVRLNQDYCPNCFKPAPQLCCFDGCVFTPQKAKKASYNPETSCRQKAEKWSEARGLPPAYWVVTYPLTECSARNIGPLLDQVEATLDQRVERWQEGCEQNGLAERLDDLWHQVRLAKQGAPASTPNSRATVPKCCRICTRELKELEVSKRKTVCVGCEPSVKRSAPMVAPMAVYEGMYEAISEPPSSPSKASAEYTSSAAFLRRRKVKR